MSIQRFFWYLALCLCAFPVLYPTYPPMVDLPQHVAAIASIDGILRESYPYANLFEFNWITPYWLGYLLVWFAGVGVGFVWGAKIVVSAAILSFILACREVRKYVGAPDLMDWPLLFLSFGFAFEWGFLNFLVALPLGVFSLLQYLKFLDGKVRWQWIAVLFSCLFFAHVLVLGFFGIVCFLASLRRGYSLRQMQINLAPFLAVVPLVAVWVFLNFKPSAVGDGPWEMGVHRLYQLPSNIFSLPLSLGNVFLSFGFLSIPFMFNAKPVFRINKIGPFAFYLMFMLLFPNYLMGNYYTYNRFNVVGFLLYFMAFDYDNSKEFFDKAKNLLCLLVYFLSVFFLARDIAFVVGYEKEPVAFQKIIKAMKPGQRVLGLIDAPQSAFYSAPVYLHYQAWYQAEKNGVADFSFAYWPGLNLTYRRDHLPSVDDSFPWHPDAFDWERLGATQYRYFVLKGTSEFAVYVLGGHQNEVALIEVSGDWFLFENRQ